MTTYMPQQQPFSGPEPEIPARPKVLRRPARFSHVPTLAPRPAATPADEPLNVQAPAPIPATHHVSWQEDSRFGLALIALLVVVNFALMLGVPLIAHDPENPEQASVTIVSSTSMPQAVITQRQRITLYSDPDMLDESTSRMDLNELPPEHTDDFSATAQEIPPPEAHPLSD